MKMDYRGKWKSILCLVVMLVLWMSLGFSALAGTIVSNNTYFTINNKNVKASDVSWPGANQCWSYANSMYQRIWGNDFDSTFIGGTAAYNALRNLNDEQRRVTPERFQ